LQPIEKTHWRDMLEAEGKNIIKNQAMSDLLQTFRNGSKQIKATKIEYFFLLL